MNQSRLDQSGTSFYESKSPNQRTDRFANHHQFNTLSPDRKFNQQHNGTNILEPFSPALGNPALSARLQHNFNFSPQSVKNSKHQDNYRIVLEQFSPQKQAADSLSQSRNTLEIPNLQRNRSAALLIPSQNQTLSPVKLLNIKNDNQQISIKISSDISDSEQTKQQKNKQPKYEFGSSLMPPRRKSSVNRSSPGIQDLIMKIEENSFSKTPKASNVQSSVTSIVSFKQKPNRSPSHQVNAMRVSYQMMQVKSFENQLTAEFQQQQTNQLDVSQQLTAKFISPLTISKMKFLQDQPSSENDKVQSNTDQNLNGNVALRNIQQKKQSSNILEVPDNFAHLQSLPHAISKVLKEKEQRLQVKQEPSLNIQYFNIKQPPINQFKPQNTFSEAISSYNNKITDGMNEEEIYDSIDDRIKFLDDELLGNQISVKDTNTFHEEESTLKSIRDQIQSKIKDSFQATLSRDLLKFYDFNELQDKSSRYKHQEGFHDRAKFLDDKEFKMSTRGDKGSPNRKFEFIDDFDLSVKSKQNSRANSLAKSKAPDSNSNRNRSLHISERQIFYRGDPAVQGMVQFNADMGLISLNIFETQTLFELLKKSGQQLGQNVQNIQSQKGIITERQKNIDQKLDQIEQQLQKIKFLKSGCKLQDVARSQEMRF